MFDVYFYECFKEEEAALRQILPNTMNCGFTKNTVQENKDKVSPAGLISVRTQSIIPVDWAIKMDGILTRSQGYDHLLAYCKQTRKKIPCGFLEEYCSRAVAEHAVMAMLVLLRKLKKQIRQFEMFERDGITGIECFSKKALVLGVGKIGSHIVDMCNGLRMKVEGVDIAPKEGDIKYVKLMDGIKTADVLFCAVPLTEQTRGLLDYTLLKGAQKGIVLINISRGEITPAQDLKDLVDEGVLGGLSLDVFPEEKEFAQRLRGAKDLSDRSARVLMELSRRDNVLFTPHNAFNTVESVQSKAKLSMQSVISFLEGKGFLWTVDLCKGDFE